MTTPTKADSSTVLVVGAGPTGLLAANLLTRLGVPCRIIEKSSELAQESRAMGIQARSLEQLLTMGLADEFVDKGLFVPGLRMNINGKEVLAINFGKVETAGGPYEFPLLIKQCDTENIIARDLKARGGAIEFNTEAIEIDVEEPSRVCVTLRRNVNSAGGDLGDQSKDQSTTEKANFAYVIGADGAHSFVRKALKLSFEGSVYPQQLLLVDCLVENWPYTGNHLRIFLSGTQVAMYFPMKEAGRARIVFVSNSPSSFREKESLKGEGGKQVDAVENSVDNVEGTHGDHSAAAAHGGEPGQFERAEALFRETTGLGDAIALKDATWISDYRIHRRHVNKYRVGRVFLAGDAAHIHSPSGGQGMNTGMQDVANLAWKLACVIKGGAPDELLDSYHSERWPVGQKAAQTSDSSFNYLATDRALVASVRNFALSWIMPVVTRGANRTANYHFTSQLTIRYHLGKYIVDESIGVGLSKRDFRAGWRAPDGHINRKLSMFDLLTAQTFTLLLLKRSSMSENEIAATTNLIKAKIPATLGGIEMKSYLICRSSIGRDPRILQAETMDVFDAYRMDSDKSEAVILVRPDGYIAYHSAALNIDNLVPFLARFQAVKEKKDGSTQP